MNKKKVCAILAALCLSVGSALPVSAAERSKNAAVFEAEEYAFYYPASDAQVLHDGHGNFTVSGLTGGAISSGDFFTTVITPETGSDGLAIDSSGYPVSPSSWQGASSSGSAAGSSTMFTVPEGGHLGTLTIRERSIQVYEGTTDSNLLRGAGHFTGTSAWDGNVCFAGHNRGPNAWFYDVKDLKKRRYRHLFHFAWNAAVSCNQCPHRFGKRLHAAGRKLTEYAHSCYLPCQ